MLSFNFRVLSSTPCFSEGRLGAMVATGGPTSLNSAGELCTLPPCRYR